MEVMMKKSVIRNILLKDTGQYLLTISAMMSVPPVLPPLRMVSPMPTASSTPAITGIITFSGM